MLFSWIVIKSFIYLEQKHLQKMIECFVNLSQNVTISDGWDLHKNMMDLKSYNSENFHWNSEPTEPSSRGSLGNPAHMTSCLLSLDSALQN